MLSRLCSLYLHPLSLSLRKLSQFWKHSRSECSMTSTAAAAAAIGEAQQHVRHAEKKLTTSLFQWKPKYRDAADLYEKAARLYASGGGGPPQRAEACRAWKNAAECHRKAHQDSSAAMCFESTALFLQTKFAADLPAASPGEVSGTLEEVVCAFELAAFLFRAEKPSRSIEILHQAVNAVDGILQRDARNQRPARPDDVNQPNPLYELYCSVTYKALELYMLFSDRDDIYPHRVPTLCRNCITRHLQCSEVSRAIGMERFLLGSCAVKSADEVREGAADGAPAKSLASALLSPSGSYREDRCVFKRLQQPSNAAKAALELVVLLLHECGGKASLVNPEFQQLCQTAYGFKNSAEMQAAAMLLSSLEDEQHDRVREVLKDDQCFVFLNGPISRIAQSFAKPVTGEAGGMGGSTEKTENEEGFEGLW